MSTSKHGPAQTQVPMPPERPQMDEIESDRAILKAAPKCSDDWDDTVWAAWWRQAERAHANEPLSTETRELIKSALSNAGAYCGECGFEPGDRTKCRDCERHWDQCADALAPLFNGTPEGLATLLAESGRKTIEIERMRVEHDRALGQVIDERDRCEEWADRLADAVGPIELIGEHSSGNNPWANALDFITPHAEVQRLKANRAATLVEAIEAARSEYLTDNTGTPEDEAYNRGVADAIAAIGKLLEGGAS